ncbi:MAG: tetratricopeptide repeat protein [Candidatus Sumerlaeaceae bacterium]
MGTKNNMHLSLLQKQGRVGGGITLRASVLALTLAAVCFTASADVVFLKNGQKQVGIITQGGPGQPRVSIRSIGGEISIPADRIERIEQEPAAASYMRLGDQYLDARRFQEGADAYKKGLEADPKHADLQSKLAQAQAGLSGIAEAAKQTADSQVQQVIAGAAELVKAKKFQEAFDALHAVEPAADSPAATPYKKAMAELYYLWGVDRADRQDTAGATEKFQMTLKYDPQNEQARQGLIQAFNGDPTKLKEMSEYYSKSSAPADQVKAADSFFKLRQYDKALPIYLKYVADPELGSNIMRDRIKIMYQNMHEELARQGNYAKAVELYQDYVQFAPDADQTPLVRYMYMVRRGETNMNDVAARVALARYAEELGLVKTAKDEYANVLAIAPDNAQANEGLKQYAAADLQDAQDYFSQGQYTLAQQQAMTVAQSYARFADIVKQAQELQTRAALEEQKVQKTKQQQAIALALRGDDYYRQAMSYFSSYVSTDIQRNTRVFFPREEASKYFRQALFAYQTALAMDPSLGDPASYNLNFKIGDAYAKYIKIANRTPPAMPKRDQDRIQRGETLQGSR